MDPLQKRYIFDRETRLREAFTQGNFGDAVQFFDGQPIADPQAALRKASAAAWMRTRSGRPEIDPTAPTWQGHKEGLAKGYFKVQEPTGISDDAVFDLIKADYQARQDSSELAFNAWAKGMPATQMFNEWSAKGEASPAKGRWGDYRQDMEKAYSKLYAENEQYREMIDRNAAKVVAGNTVGFKEFADELMQVPKEKQRLIIRAMAAKASDNPDEQRAWYAKLGEGMGRMAESLVGAAESGFADIAAASAMAELGAVPNADSIGLIEGIEAGRQTNRDYYSLVNMIRKTADEKIDPLEMEGFIGSSMLEVSRMTPLIATSLVPIAGQATLISWFRDDVSSNLMLDSDEISRESADAIGNVAAVPLAATEMVSSMIPIGKLPFLSKFLKQGVSTWTRAAARGAAYTATGVAVENVEEAVQQVIPNYVQEFFAAVRQDVDYVNFEEQERQLMKLPGQVTGPALILSLVGGGVNSISAVKNGRALAMDTDIMVATGIAPEVATQIQAAAQTGNWPQVDQLYTGAFNKDKGGYDGATDEQRQQAAQAYIQKQTTAAKAEKSLEMSGALAPIRRTADKWQVLPSDGSAPVTFDTFDQANRARWQDAQMRSLRLDGITRQAIEQADKMLQAGEQNVYEFSAEEMTKELAVQRGLVSTEQVQQREQQAAALDEGMAEDQDYRRAMNEAAAKGDTEPVTTILGMSSLEMRDGIQTGVVRLFKGANFTDLIEEISETSLKRFLAAGQVQRDGMVQKLRDVEKRLQAMEQAEGQKPSLLFRTSDDAQLTESDVIEAFSHLAKSYYINAAEQGKGSGWRTADKNLPRYLRRLRAAIEQTGFYEWIKTLGTKLRAIFTRAAQIEKLRKEGQLDVELESIIRQSLGLETQAVFDRQTVEEAQAIADEAGGTTMSMSRAVPEDDSKVTVLPDGAKLIGPTTFSIRAYHGTPHKVDQFSTDKIGTGEGAQAYGWGLYFAENRDVAKGYQEKLSGGRDAGYFYTVELLPDEETFLDWDKPLHVKILSVVSSSLEISKAIDPDGYGLGTQIKGHNIYSILANKLGAKEASELLAKNGIPGIRYLDGNSRDAGKGTYNYVIFDEYLVKIIEENGVPRKQSSTTMSTGQQPQAGTLEERLAAMFDPFQKSPELRRRIGLVVQERVSKVAQQFANVIGSTAKTQEKLSELDTKYSEELAAARADYEAEVSALRAERDLEMGGAKTEGRSKQDIEKINTDYARRIGQRQREWEREKAEMERKQASERAALNKGLAGLSADSIVSALRTLNAAVSALPADVKAKILPGGSVKIARLKTPEAQLQAIEQIVQRADVELEKWLKKETTALVEKTFKRYAPSRESGEKPKGKLDPDAQELVDLAETAMGLSPEALIEQLGAIDAALANPDITPEQEALLDRKRVMLELFGDWKNADAGRMDAALDALEQTASEGWAKWKLKQIQKAEQRQEIRDNLRKDTGKKGLAGERDSILKESAGLIGKTRDVFLNLASFSEALHFVFGKKSKTAAEIVDQERAASYQYEDAVQDIADSVQDFFTTLAGGVLKGEQMRFDMSRPKITVGKGDNQRTLSELQGIQALLMWQQEDGKRHMEGPRDESNQPIPGKWSYDQAWIDELTAKLPPRALRTKAFLESLYAAEYEPLNALYRERHGVNLPRHKMYAPITVAPQQAKAGEMVDPVSGAAISGSILTPGALRSRNRTAVAEPRFDDALAIFIAHNKQMEHWKAYYDFAVQAQAVFGNREVMNSVEAAAGKEAVKMLRQRVDSFAQGGIRDAGAGLAMTQTFQRIVSRAAVVGLLGRISTLLVQSTQLAAAAVQMPTGAYMVRLSKLLTGNLSWGDAINSDFIQRRIKTAPPIVQQAMQGLGTASRPNQITRAVRGLGQLLSGADGLFTGGTYAILLDWNRTQGAKMGLEGAELEAFAHSEAARLTEEVAQPVRMANRSMMEVTTTNPLAKSVWAYSSEARQKIALFAWAAQQATNNPTRFVKVGFLTFIVGGLMAQVIKNLWRETKGDDDERKWSAERLALSTIAGPLHGLPGFSEFTGNGGMFNSAVWAKSSGTRLYDAITGEEDYDSMTDAMRDVSSVLGAAGYFNDTLAGMGALSNAGLDFAKLLENAFTEE